MNMSPEALARRVLGFLLLIIVGWLVFFSYPPQKLEWKYLSFLAAIVILAEITLFPPTELTWKWARRQLGFVLALAMWVTFLDWSAPERSFEFWVTIAGVLVAEEFLLFGWTSALFVFVSTTALGFLLLMGGAGSRCRYNCLG